MKYDKNLFVSMTETEMMETNGGFFLLKTLVIGTKFALKKKTTLSISKKGLKGSPTINKTINPPTINSFPPLSR